ncbi:Major Facilitator Superfamily protein [Malonomonas rubra DSM 5091]|uniref:Major Facilitator Superfamily protein n=1 Tax=Malonomonas rubra DSM 5091 TaxID=1122189 RepID=A0A1M6H6K7_MALRU|nr:MFS transporter [Malonomonas rubra]SHJ17820.1 Major Facilitator Superfamily protein [Malonomonas rubra DSM 5091]
MSATSSPYQISNVRLFIIFRVLFNCRFYYPIFSILFLDFGLTLSQFAILNAVWAATIVLCEVPSGALADTIGRRNLLVFAGSLMVIEIGLWSFVPADNLTLLFWVFVLNRILSGMAEAAASGADEALAYDSMKAAGLAKHWPHVLERQGQFQAAGFVIAMTLGGVLYDPALLEKIAGTLGSSLEFSRDSTLRLPIYLTLATAICTLLTTLKMREVQIDEGVAATEKSTTGAAFRLVWQAGCWIFRTPFVLGLILFGLLYDSVVRMLLTMASQYYRIIGIPEGMLGILGSALSLFGFVMPGLARRLSEKHTPLTNLLFTAALIFLGLIGMCFVWPWVGIVPALLLFSSMFLIGFFLSHYLNEATSSEQRATVLSFKGLFLNLGYGLIGFFYALLLANLRGSLSDQLPQLGEEGIKNLVFVESLPWFSGYFACCLFALLLFFTRSMRRKQSDSQ